MDYTLDISRSTIFSPHIADICSEASEASYTRYEDIQLWSSAQDVIGNKFHLCAWDGYTDEKLIAMWDEALRQCSKLLWENCINHTENIFKNWYEREKVLYVSVNELIIRGDQENDSSSDNSDTD
ncbi:hypothetical protein FQA39_LY10448 [Lamprigera yunnana]|nr:hypothetical protein FQA39_LY10448 [Lamprigera yunnana]